METIALIGFMATGKSSVGHQLAQALGYTLVDLDSQIVAQAGCSIAEIFTQQGEEGFRQLEHKVLAQCVQEQGIILSCGGGVVLQAENRKLLRQSTRLVSLIARPEVIARRVAADPGPERPLLANRPAEQTLEQRVTELLAQRLPLYQDAELVLDTSDLTIAEITEAIVVAVMQDQSDPASIEPWAKNQAKEMETKQMETKQVASKQEHDKAGDRMKTVQVSLGQRSYPIEIATGLLAQIGTKAAALVQGRQMAVITDSQVGPLYAEIVAHSLQEAGFQVKVITIPAGEPSKSWAMAEEILSVLLAEQFHRDSSILALGGGVVGDLAGFVASIYQRGIAFFQVPTSLLAQVDSSVGGKVAVNHALGKNMIGSFYQPRAVWIDLEVLTTLEERHWRNGLAEVIKYGVIYSAPFFAYLQAQRKAILDRQREAVAEVIATCCQLKAEVVALDEQEGGIRAKLNYGHTIGHGLEIAGHYTGFLHGEAVAVGMVLAAQYAAETGRCSTETAQAVIEMVAAYQLPVTFGSELAIEDILTGMALDKKVQDGQWVMILPESIGQVSIVKGIPQVEIRQLLEQQL